jgi:hypothetical protein
MMFSDFMIKEKLRQRQKYIIVDEELKTNALNQRKENFIR